jgi:peptidoglycan/LPS O-acetylase OafA/YrhL
VHRGFRILPIYLASLALYAVVMYSVGFGGSHRSVFTQALPWYLSPFPEVPFFTKTHIVFSLAWSLGIEEKFYLLWPLLAFVLLRKHARGRVGVALLLALVAQLPIAFSAGGRASQGDGPRVPSSRLSPAPDPVYAGTTMARPL